MTKEQLIEDFRIMIEADRGHLLKALENGERFNAHRFVDAIIDTQQELEDLGARVR